MDDRQNDEPRTRASLRGKGHEILLGQHSDAGNAHPEAARAPGAGVPAQSQDGADPSILALTPEEMDALLDFADDSPVYRPGYTFSRSENGSAWGADQGQPLSTLSQNSQAPVDRNWEIGDYSEELPDFQDPAGSPVLEAQQVNGHGFSKADNNLLQPDVIAASAEAWDEVGPDDTSSEEWADDEPDEHAEATVELTADGVPIAERHAGAEDGFSDPPYEPHTDVQALTPSQPERWSDVMLTVPDHEYIEPVFTRVGHDAAASAEEMPSDFQPAAPEDDGGALPPSTDTQEVEAMLPTAIGDPFPIPPRTGSEELFKTTPPPDKGMLDQLVDDKRIQKLWKQIETLHEELVAEVEGDRSTTDDYQRELLRASGLLLESRQNYDDTRAIVYRIRADLNRRRKVTADIRRYRPMLMAYYVGWGVALAALFLLKRPLMDLSDSFGSTVIAALYYPLLLGIAGALISGYLTLDRHTTRQRDFDPIHITWYLFNPLLGGVMGLLMFLLASIANEDLLQEAASRGEMAITFLLCVIAGMNQSNVLRRLNELMDRFGTSSKK